MIKAVFFDLFETLITEWDGDKKKAKHSTDGLGIEIKVFNKEWSSRREKRMDGTFEDCRSCLIEILRSQNIVVDERAIETFVKRRIQAKKVAFENIDKQIIRTLEEIKDTGVKIGLISNCAPEEVSAWEASTLSELFNDVVFSFKEKCAKPDEEIYKIALNNLCVLPEQAIFVGDGGSNELQGAMDAGIKAFHATWFQPTWKSDKIKEFPKLNTPSQVIDVI